MEENKKPEEGSCGCSAHGVAELPTGRRCFMAQAGTVVLAAAATAPAILTAASTVLTPIVSKKAGGSDDGGKAYRVTTFDQLPEDGTPAMFSIKDDRMDGWTKYENISVGAVWVRRTGDKTVQAFQSICPHAGCPIMYDEKARQFYCPCHAALFTLDGVRTEEPSPSPSPRDMDTLEAVVEADGSVVVRYQRFKEGPSVKIVEG
ncbi:MAG: Rieske (2Fe-2S) protein [Planctomycetia bacterium]|nr:Rieske (2Fe-2S) protein [Planctomycetia bacterium]